MADEVLDTPIGPLRVETSRLGLRRIDFWHEAAPFRRDSSDQSPEAIANLGIACTQLREYFAAERQDFELDFDLEGSDFQLRVWRAIASIPHGCTLSYGELAMIAGAPGAARAAGSACGANKVAIVIPCHRVIGADGSLHGFGAGLEVKAWLLRHEQAETTAQLTLV